MSRPVAKGTLFIAARPTATLKEIQQAAAAEGMELKPNAIRAARRRLQNGLGKHPDIRALLPKKYDTARSHSRRPAKEADLVSAVVEQTKLAEKAYRSVMKSDGDSGFRISVVDAASNQESLVEPALSEPQQKLNQLRRLVLELGLDAVEHAIRDYVWVRDNPR